MLIETVKVQRFRSIFDEEIHLLNLTTLLGSNGSGKSTFLRALELFYTTSPKVEKEDFYDNDIREDILIAVTFCELSNDARELFSKYVRNEKLTVEKVFSFSNGKISATYHGAALRNPEFAEVRSGLDIKDRGATARVAYNTIRERQEYLTLPAWSTIAAVEPALLEWESSNPTLCVSSRDDGRFFGFSSVGEGYLGRFSRFLFIPAVRDAATDAAEGRGSALTDLMDMVVRSVIAQKTEVQQLRAETQRQYEQLLSPENLTELGKLSTDLTSTLQTFVPTASVDLTWLPLDQIDIKMPRADIKLVEDEFGTTVHRTGHGLQRAFILTMLQHLALAQSSLSADQNDAMGEDEDKYVDYLPSLLLAIEEPELFQHPSRQRHFSTILNRLSTGSLPGVAGKTQVICATHSPLFVALEQFDSLRMIRKIAGETGKPRITKVICASMAEIADKLWLVDGNDGPNDGTYSADTLPHRLRAIMTPHLNEGFFANAVVLVEGEDDHAAITAMSRLNGIDLDSLGIALIPVGGKRNLDRPALIFQQFGIPVYIVWDADSGRGETQGKCDSCGRALDNKPDPKDNHRLLRIVGAGVTDWPSGIDERYCCFEVDLETTLSTELGVETFERCLAECQAEFGIQKRRHALKNPSVISTLLTKAHESGARSATLDRVVHEMSGLIESSH